MVFKIHSLISRQMSTKFSWIQQKICEIPFFFYRTHLLEIESHDIGAISQKGIFTFDKFSFEITRNHLVARQSLKLLTQLLRDWEAANLKLTNQKVMQAWKTKQTVEEMWWFLWLLLICLSWKNNGHFRPIFEPPLRSN